MAHRLFVALALGWLAVLCGCNDDDSGISLFKPPDQTVEFSTVAALDSFALTFCCNPEGPFPMRVARLTITLANPDAHVEISGTVPGVGISRNHAEESEPEERVYDFTVQACPPEGTWQVEIAVLLLDGRVASRKITITHDCPDALEIALEGVDQLFRADGPIANVGTNAAAIAAGAALGAFSGNAAEGFDQVFDQFFPASYGAMFLRHVPSNTTQLVAYGAEGLKTRYWDAATGSWTPFIGVEPPIGDRNATDAVPTANDPDTAEGVVTRNGKNQVEVYGYDTAVAAFLPKNAPLQASLFPGASGKMISACRPEVDGPLYVLFNSLASQLYVKTNPLDVTPAVLLATLGNDSRRVRHEKNLLFVTSYADGTLTVLRRETNGTVTVTATESVGRGPIGVDTKTLPNSRISVLTTASLDNTYTVSVMDSDGTNVSSTTRAVPGDRPVSGVFLDGWVAIAANGSDKLLFLPE